MAQTGGPDVITVRIVHGSAGHIYMATSTGQGKTEISDVEVPTYTHKNIGQVTDIYQQTIAKLTQQGYTLKGMSGGDITTTLVFMKEK
jgi:hypothetical protein